MIHANFTCVFNPSPPKGEATIHYNKLQADPKQGKSLDIGNYGLGLVASAALALCFQLKVRFVAFLVLKKVKHRLVENMSSGTADALGLSRAILCNGELLMIIAWMSLLRGVALGVTHRAKQAS